MASEQQGRYKGLYDQWCKGPELELGSLVLVRSTVGKARHKIQDRQEDEAYQVVGQPISGTPACKPLGGGHSRIFHINLHIQGNPGE